MCYIPTGINVSNISTVEGVGAESSGLQPMWVPRSKKSGKKKPHCFRRDIKKYKFALLS